MTMMSLIGIVIVLISCRMQCRLVGAECLDSEALFKVSYSISPEDQQKFQKLNDLVVELHFIPSINARYEIIQGEYPWDEHFTFEMCIPRENSCGQVAIFGPPKEQFDISWDGEPITMTEDVVPTIQHDTTMDIDSSTSTTYQSYLTAVEFGNDCVPECGENEALFENQYRTTAKYKISIEPYLVQDQNGATVIAHREQSTYDTFLYIERHCLPRDEGNCYRLIMGDRSAISEADDEAEHISISYDGMTIFESQAWYYESLEFGDSCPGTGVRSCDLEKESMLEFFMTTQMPDVTWPKLSWEVLMHDRSQFGYDFSQVIHSGVQSDETGISLQYDSICVPKKSCLTLSILTVEDEDMRWQYTSLDYKISLDKTIYRKQRLDSLISPNIETALIGECAKLVNPICNITIEDGPFLSLLDLSFQTVSAIPDSDKSTSSNNHFPYYASSWYVSDSTDMTAWILQSSDFIDDFEYGSIYRVLQCIPKERCAYSLYVNQRAEFDTYSITLNGRLSTADPIEVGKAELTLASYDATSLNELCDGSTDSSISGKNIAAILISMLVAAVALIIGCLYVKRRHHHHIMSSLGDGI